MRSYSSQTHDSSFDVAQLAHGRGGEAAGPAAAVQAYPATDIAQTKQVDSMVRHNLAMGMQAKLTIGEPNDQYEQEADRTAAQVMSMPDSAVQQSVQREMAPEEEELQMKPLAAGITPLVQRESLPEEEETMQMKSAQSGGAAQSGFHI
jgi:hypothetical protein